MMITTLLLYIGCLPEMISTITASVVDSEGSIIPESSISIRDQNGSKYSSALADINGLFTIELPAYANFFLIISAANYETSSFTVSSGEGEFQVEDGTLWLRTAQEILEISNEFTDCTTDKGMIDGEVRVAISGQEIDSLPLVTSAEASAFSLSEEEFSGCYLATIDEETGESSPASQTGETGRFSVFGLQEGPHLLEITVDYDEEITETFPYLVYVPEDGNVPLYPALITLFEE